MAKNENVIADFEIVDDTSKEVIVFRKIPKRKGKNRKEMKAIEEKQPTTTLYYFTEEEINKFREIEIELLKENNVDKKHNSTSIKEIIFNFFDL